MDSVRGGRSLKSSHQDKPKEHPKYNLVEECIKRADEMVDLINMQPDDSIRSLDTFFHGNPQAISLSTAPPDTKIMTDKPYMREWWREEYRASLYVSLVEKKDNIGSLRTIYDKNGSASINSIKYNKFTENAKIEIHGCKAAENFVSKDTIERRQALLDEWPFGVGNWIYGDFSTRDDNIAATISQKLYNAGKKNQ